jgi:hypothetical protein
MGVRGGDGGVAATSVGDVSTNMQQIWVLFKGY